MLKNAVSGISQEDVEVNQMKSSVYLAPAATTLGQQITHLYLTKRRRVIAATHGSYLVVMGGVNEEDFSKHVEVLLADPRLGFKLQTCLFRFTLVQQLSMETSCL